MKDRVAKRAPTGGESARRYRPRRGLENVFDLIVVNEKVRDADSRD